MSRPPNKLLSRLKVAAPRHMAKKKSFRSAPRMVSGRDSDRCTALILRCWFMAGRRLRFAQVSRKEPSHEVDGRDGHTHAEENTGEDTLRAAFSEGEGQTGDDNRDERQPARDG